MTPSLNHRKVNFMILPDAVLMRQAQYLGSRGGYLTTQSNYQLSHKDHLIFLKVKPQLYVSDLVFSQTMIRQFQDYGILLASL